jgi:DNA-binding CsgD family transcriptional regulator
MTPLVGRAAQVELLDQALSMVAGGRLVAVEVCSEPGVGKTRMLHELGARANRSGYAVYHGRATEFEQEVPYGMYAEALEPLISKDAAERTGEAQLALAALRGEAHTTTNAGGPMDRLRVYSGVRRLLVDSAARGVVLLLDDLHWADHSSLELTEYLIRKPPPIPMLIAIAFRSACPPARLVDAVAHHGPAAIQLNLLPLGPDDLTALLPDVPEQRREMIMRASRGNPLYIQALSRLTDGALTALLAELDAGEPWADSSGRHVLAGIAAEILTLDRRVREVAHAAAVVADQATVPLVAHVAQLPVDAVVGAVDRLYALGYVEVDGAWCRFRHPLMRAAARSLAGPARQATAHARAVEYLRAHHAPVQVLAHHTERSARPGDQTAASTLVEAGQAFAYSAPAQAARWLAAALRIMPSAGPLGERRPAVQLLYARTLGLSGNLDECRHLLAELRTADGPVRTEAEAFSAVVARLRGDIDEAAALLDAQLRDGRLDAAAQGKVMVQLAAIRALREDAAGTVTQAERALGLLDADRSAFAAGAQALRAFGTLYDGSAGAARHHIADAVRIVDAVPDAALRPHVELFGPLAWVETYLGELPAAARHLARAREVVDSVGQSSALPYLLVVEVEFQTRMGRLGAALRLAREAAAAADRVGSTEMRAMADAVLLRPLLWSSGPAAAIAVARRLSESHRPRSAMWRRVAHVNLALAYAVAGETRVCLSLLSGPPERWPAGGPITMLRLVLRAVALALTGELVAARADADRAGELAESAGSEYDLGLAALARAVVADRAALGDEAAARAGTAAAQLARADAPLEAALAHHLAGAVHTRAGRQQAAHAEFAKARAGYQVCGATWLCSAVGNPAPPAQAADPLTTREREIADLVMVGLTNQEVAARLFLSRRTVESHLSRIFAKLGVRSRTAMTVRLS